MKQITSSILKGFFVLTILFEASAFSSFNKVFVAPQAVENMCQQIHQLIKDDEFKPELLVGISRGGLTPLGYLAGEKMFDMRNTLSLSIQSYEKQSQSDVRLLFPVHFEDLKNYKTILVVDDIVDSGKTFKFVTSLLKEQLSDSIVKTAALFYKPKSSVIRPDYYVEETEDWIVFPWEKRD